jgi:dihydrofolate synthase / folylpolyglutamate synthase
LPGSRGSAPGLFSDPEVRITRLAPILARLHDLHPRLIDLSLDRLLRLLAQLDHPEQRLPPVLHVAGTNGKGSTCAMMRAIAEAAGLHVHVYTSPHLVRLNERYRVAGALVTDDMLADTMETIERVNDGAPITVFEVMTAAAFVLFAQIPADLCILEVGLGGRGDATNVITPAACAVTSISLDHREMLGDTLALIAAEKAGIFKPGVPAVTGLQPPEALAALLSAGPLLVRDRDWTIEPTADGLRYADAAGALDLPRPNLLGPHQVDNAGIAVATLRAAGVPLPESAFAGLARAVWPARLQRLKGRVAAMVPGREVWLDGGHNPGGGEALAAFLQDTGPAHVVVGMKQAKDTAEFLRPLLPYAASLWAIAEPEQHLALPVEAIIAASGGIARPGPTVAAALAALDGGPDRVLICGSLYLAGEVLKMDGFTPE